MYLLEVIEMILELDKKAIAGCLPLFPVLGIYILPTVPILRSYFKDTAFRGKVLRQPALYKEWTLWRPLCNLLRFWWAGVQMYLSFQAPYKFSSLLTLQVQTWRWSASLFSLSLPCLYGVQFWTSPRELTRLWTNNIYILPGNSLKKLTFLEIRERWSNVSIFLKLLVPSATSISSASEWLLFTCLKNTPYLESVPTRT